MELLVVLPMGDIVPMARRNWLMESQRPKWPNWKTLGAYQRTWVRTILRIHVSMPLHFGNHLNYFHGKLGGKQKMPKAVIVTILVRHNLLRSGAVERFLAERSYTKEVCHQFFQYAFHSPRPTLIGGTTFKGENPAGVPWNIHNILPGVFIFSYSRKPSSHRSCTLLQQLCYRWCHLCCHLIPRAV